MRSRLRYYLLVWTTWAILGGLAVLTHGRVQVWRSNHTLWSEAVQKAPDSARAHYRLSVTLRAEGDTREADHELQQALTLASEQQR